MSNVEVSTLASQDASVARVEVQVGHVQFAATGSAKKHPNDPSVVSVGETLALARAFQRIAADLEVYALETNASHIAMEKAFKKFQDEGYEL